MALFRENHAYAIDTQPLNMDTKLQNKSSFNIESLLRNTTSPESSRSISPSSVRSRSPRSPPISPGSEEMPQTAFIPRPGLLSHIYPNGSFYGFQGPQPSSLNHMEGIISRSQHLQNTIAPHGQMPFSHMQIEWFARTGGMLYSARLPDLAG